MIVPQRGCSPSLGGLCWVVVCAGVWVFVSGGGGGGVRVGWRVVRTGFVWVVWVWLVGRWFVVIGYCAYSPSMAY